MSVNDEAEHAHQYRLMQASRLIRYLGKNGIDPRAYVADPSILDISPMLDADGKIIPESGTADRVAPSTRKRVVRVPTGNDAPEPP